VRTRFARLNPFFDAKPHTYWVPGVLRPPASDDRMTRTTGAAAPRSLRGIRSASLYAAGVCSATNDAADAGHPLVTVVLCTLGREPRLRNAVRAVLAQTHGDLDVVVVDNDPGSGGLGKLLADVPDRRLRIVAEPVPGLSMARNAGLREARGPLLAFTDDDAVPEPTWIAHLLEVFAADRTGAVTCVTGRVLAAETATDAQQWFENLGVFDKGDRRTVWTLENSAPAELGALGERSIFFPYTAGEMGSGNNMAFRTDALRRLGGFDEALGAGTPTRGAEDLDAFRRVVLAGHVLVYNPDAVVWHHHRETYAGLRRQLFGYGVGMAASLTKVLLRGDRASLGVLRCLPRGVQVLLAPGSSKNVKNPANMPRALIGFELLGYALGPLAYSWSRLRPRGRR